MPVMFALVVVALVGAGDAAAGDATSGRSGSAPDEIAPDEIADEALVDDARAAPAGKGGATDPALSVDGDDARDERAVRVVVVPSARDTSTHVLVEGVVLGDTTPGPLSSPSSALFAGRSATLWAGLRGGALVPVWGDLVVGGDGTLAFSRSSQGTSYVGETWTRGLVEARFLVGYRLALGRAALTPLALASSRLELGVANLTVLREPRYTPIGALGARVGAGLMLEAGHAVFRTDCANGVRTFSFDVACTLGVGASF